MNSKELLIKKNEEKRNFETYKKLLEKVFEYEFSANDFLDYENANRLMDLFFSKVQENAINKGTFSINHRNEIEKKLQSLVLLCDKSKLFLLTNWNNIPWATLVNVDKAVSNYNSIIFQIDKDSLNITNDDCSVGIYLDLYEENGETFYELEYWGL